MSKETINYMEIVPNENNEPILKVCGVSETIYPLTTPLGIYKANTFMRSLDLKTSQEIRFADFAQYADLVDELKVKLSA